MAYDYDVVVIGGGAAGLTSSGIAASFGAKTALIESEKLGGDCTWYGCVPSKALLKAAKVAHTIRTSDKYGLNPSEPEIDFSKIIEKVHNIQKNIYEEADAPPIYEKMGIDVISGKAQFLTKHSIEINNKKEKKIITSRNFVVATGSKPVIPQIPGLSDVSYLTNESIFSLNELPKKLIVIGGGPIGVEMAQSFQRIGSEVVIIDYSDSILGKDDRELSNILKDSLQKEGIEFHLNTSVIKIDKENGKIRIIGKDNLNDKEIEIEGDNLLVSVGRKANITDLNLNAAGIKTNKSGILINNSCQTTVKNIYACGDVAGRYQFTHMAEHMAKVALSKMLLHIPMKIDEANIPWCTYTDPEVAHVGANEKYLKEKNISYEVFRFPFSKIDRAITDSENIGLIKVYATKLTGKIYGVDIIGHNAGEMISEYALALRNGITLRQMADTIHPYPTYGLGNRRAADQWYVRKQSRLFVKLLQIIFRYRGQLPDTSDPDRII